LLDALLLTLNDQPLLLAIVLFGATFVVEDVATIAAGLFVARTGTDPFAASSLGRQLAISLSTRWGAGALGLTLARSFAPAAMSSALNAGLLAEC
jgi:hypothetical protein